MSADLPQLRILRYAPPLTVLSYPFLFLPSRFPSNVIYPPTHPHFSLSLSPSLPLYRPVFRVYLSSSSPSRPFSLLKPPPSPHSISIPFSLPSSIQWLDSLAVWLREFEKTSGKTRFPPRWSGGYFKQLLSAFLPLTALVFTWLTKRLPRTWTRHTRGPLVPARSSPCSSFIARFGTSIPPPSPSLRGR